MQKVGIAPEKQELKQPMPDGTNMEKLVIVEPLKCLTVVS